MKWPDLAGHRLSRIHGSGDFFAEVRNAGDERQAGSISQGAGLIDPLASAIDDHLVPIGISAERLRVSVRASQRRKIRCRYQNYLVCATTRFEGLAALRIEVEDDLVVLAPQNGEHLVQNLV